MELTEVPLQPTEHLEHGGDECAQHETRAALRDVNHPDEADETVGDLYAMSTVENIGALHTYYGDVI